MEYKDFLKAGEKSNMSNEELEAYCQSVYKEADYRRGIKWAAQLAASLG